MKALSSHWQTRLAEWRDSGYWRTRKIISQRSATHLIGDQKRYLNFASNDYLNLGTTVSVVSAFTAAAHDYGGVGSGASPAVSGYSLAQANCERDLAAYFAVENACIFSSGYLSNLAILSTLFDAQTCVYLDRDCHASLIDACRLAGVQWRRYRHNNVAHCRELLHKDAGTVSAQVIITEGVFSALGDIAPLANLKTLADEFKAYFVVDDTHGLGTQSPSGRGSLEQAGCSNRDADIVIGSFGKALGGAGGFVLCSTLIYDMLTQFARPLMFNTALPPALFAAMSESLRLLQTEPLRRDQLFKNIAFFQAQAQEHQLPISAHPSAIQTLTLGDAQRAQRAQEACLAQQLLVGLLRYPTVAKNRACLRISLSAAHSPADIMTLLNCLTTLDLQYDRTTVTA